MQEQCCKKNHEIELDIHEVISNSQSRIHNISLQCLIQQYLMNFEILEQIKLWNFKLHKINEIQIELQKFVDNQWNKINCLDSNQFENNICIHEYIQDCQQRLLEIDDLKDNYLRNILSQQDYQEVEDQIVSQNLFLNDFILNYSDQQEKTLEQITRNELFKQKNNDKEEKIITIFELMLREGYYSKTDNVYNEFQTYQDRILKHHKIESYKQFYIQSYAIVYKQKADQNLIEIGLNLIDRSLALDELNTKSLRIKALLLYDSQRFEESIQICDKAISLQPKQSQLYYDKGLALEGLNKFEEALKMHEQAIQLNPVYSKAYNNKGLCLRHLQNYSEAIEMYNQALKIEPKYSTAYHNKGSALRCLGKNEEAIEMFDKAINLDPQLKYSYYSKGFSLQCLKQYEESIKMYDQAIKFGFMDANIYKKKAESLFELRRYRISKDNLELYLGKIPKQVENSEEIQITLRMIELCNLHMEG